MSSRELPPWRCQRSADLLAYKPLVRQIAGRLRARLSANVGIDELEQAGLIGLNEALTRFEEGRGSSFETYAARRIEGAMLDSLRATDTLPRHVRAKLRQVKVAVQRLEHKLGRSPRAKEVANELDWTLEEFHDCMADAGAGAMRSGDEELENAEDMSFSGGAEEEPVMLGVVDEHADPMRAVQLRQRHAALNAAFDALEEAERYVMESIYDRQLGLRDIGAKLGVSEGRVSQMSAEIIAKLRRRMRQW
jgi:RNA polymerase sigma factor for flagellar operon FliA